MEYYSAIKEPEISPFAATWMDLEIIILSEVSQIQKDKYHMISLMCGLWKSDANELICKTETDSQIYKTFSYQRGKVGVRDKLGDLDQDIHTTIYKIDHQQGPTV